MRKYLLALALTTLLFPASAFACECPENNEALATKLLNDSSVAYAQVYVRGMNMNNGKSMLELRNTIHGGLSARDFRASFSTRNCGVVPKAGAEQNLLIKFEKDGTYSVMNQCETKAISQHFKRKN